MHCRLLQLAARIAARAKLITNGFAKKLGNLDIAFSVTRRIAEPSEQPLIEDMLPQFEDLAGCLAASQGFNPGAAEFVRGLPGVLSIFTKPAHGAPKAWR